MPTRLPADIRNIVLCGAGSSGKTTLTERLLFQTGTIKRLGTVNEGTTASDYLEEEKAYRHSLQPTLVHLEYEGHLVNLIDTPGLADFVGHAIACFPAVETVAVVVDAQKGIDSVTRRLMAVAAERRIPRMLIVNKIDEHNLDLEGLLESLREVFGSVVLPINLPTPPGTDVVNVFEHDGTDASGDAALFSSVREAHKRIVEQVIEVDDELTMQYLEVGDGRFDPVKLHAAFEKALEDAHLIPVCFTSAKTGVGVDDLLHCFASLCPSPLEVNPPEFVRRESPEGEEKEWHAAPDPAGKLLAHVFRVTADAFLGKTGIFRVWQGTMRARTEVIINDQRKPLRVAHLFQLQGREHAEVEAIGPGGIGAVSKLEEIHFNATLHDSHELDSVRLRPLPLPRPMYGLAVELKNHADENRFSTAVHRLQAEDPCFVVERIAATGQTVMKGLGELHLRVIVERLRKHFGIEVTTSAPRVAYKETITTVGDARYRHKKQTGGAGQFGEVSLRLEPLPADHPEGFEFVSAVVGGAVPRQYWPAVEKGCRQVLGEGAIAGYPIHGVRVTLYDGKYHEVDSKEVAFVTAGRRCFIEAFKQARPVLMEPYVTLEITAPSRYLGDIAGHLSTKRGRVQSSDVEGRDSCVVRAVAPMGELQNYPNELKSMTGGAGAFTMAYSHDERTPAHIQSAVIAAFKPRAEQD